MSMMIDAEKLLEWLEKNTKSYPVNEYLGVWKEEINPDHLKSKIQELKQESDFDADGWCWDMGKAPTSENLILFRSDNSVVCDRLDKFTANEIRIYFRAWRPLPAIPKTPKN